jgi:hypothetical protein
VLEPADNLLRQRSSIDSTKRVLGNATKAEEEEDVILSLLGSKKLG